jgi:hypothetical protein
MTLINVSVGDDGKVERTLTKPALKKLTAARDVLASIAQVLPKDESESAATIGDDLADFLRVIGGGVAAEEGSAT